MLESNQAFDNGLRGYSVVGTAAAGNTLNSNEAAGNGSSCPTGEIRCGGFILSFGASSNTLDGNTATFNIRYGFAAVTGATSNQLRHNDACDNTVFDGFQDAVSTGNTRASNTFCTQDGLS
jgi:parallel beta-helix repeat protein